MVETIAPVVYGTKRGYWGAVALHSLAAGATGAAFGTTLAIIGFVASAPWGSASGVVVAICAVTYAAREFFGLPLPLFDRKQQVPDWWRTFYSPHVAAALYGAGLGIGFLTFLRYGTYVVVCAIALASGEPLVGALLGGTFGLARGLTAMISARSPDEEEAAAVVTRLEATATGSKPRLANAVMLVLVAAIALLTACNRTHPTSSTAPAAEETVVERVFGRPHRIGHLRDPRLTESSGVAASRSQDGVLWTHNDSGGGPYLYALDSEGATLGRWTVKNALSTDWEDIAMGPDGDIYIGDIGDNESTRRSIVVYRVSEPNVSNGGGITESAKALILHYPDRPHDAEGLLVHPITGAIYVVTKRFSGRVVIYGSQNPEKQQELAKVATFELPGALGGVTAGDISPDGAHVILGTYDDGFEFTLADPSGDFNDIWSVTPQEIELGTRRQGESIAYNTAGTALIMTSEGAGTSITTVKVRSGN
jgi:hypothetical protein